MLSSWQGGVQLASIWISGFREVCCLLYLRFSLVVKLLARAVHCIYQCVTHHKYMCIQTSSYSRLV